MNPSRFHTLLHTDSSTDPKAEPRSNIVFSLHVLPPKKISLDKTDICFDISYSSYNTNMNLSDIYVGDYQEKDIYFTNTNPLLPNPNPNK